MYGSRILSALTALGAHCTGCTWSPLTCTAVFAPSSVCSFAVTPPDVSAYCAEDVYTQTVALGGAGAVPVVDGIKCTTDI
jgi:hypothetical protein